MKSETIPAHHRAIAEAAVRAVLGERAFISKMVEAPTGRPLSLHITAFGSGVQAFWNHWTGRHPFGEREER